jgi:hypothetical protein
VAKEVLKVYPSMGKAERPEGFLAVGFEEKVVKGLGEGVSVVLFSIGHISHF